MVSLGWGLGNWKAEYRVSLPKLSAATTLQDSLPLGQPKAASILSTLIPACQIYLLINAVLSSLLLAFSETRPAKAALYFPFIASLSLSAFAFASAGGLSLLAA
jgi:hypothetical protein